MRRQRKLQCTRDILATLKIIPLDYFTQTYCVFQEDAIMTQQTTPRMKSVVATTTICVIIGILICSLPQATSLGSECYTITGVDYRGTQDEIGLPPEAGDLLKYTECLPWNTSIESTKRGARERGIGKHNYCRNPDNDILPWCKIAGIEGSDGAWGYCHLPSCKVPGYIGCFPNLGEPSVLDGIWILHKDMTVGACIDFCRRNDYKYAGLEAGHACYCGNDGYDRYGTSANRGTHCANKCFGNKGQPCGGDGYVDVYDTNIGSCGSDTVQRTVSGVVYSPGYPDHPGSPAMVSSLGATELMMRAHRDSLKEKKKDASDIEKRIEDTPMAPAEKCSWKIEVKKASKIDLLIREIDPKNKLGGIIEIEAENDGSVVVMTSHKSNVTSQTVFIAENAESRHNIDVIIPESNIENGNTGAVTNVQRTKPEWSAELAKRRWRRYTLPSNSLHSKVSIRGGAFTVHFLRSADLLATLKSAYEFPRSRSSRSRRKQSEWGRFAIEYEASFPPGVTYDPDDVTDDDVIVEESITNDSKRHPKKTKPVKSNESGETEPARKTITTDSITDTKFSISKEDALAIKQAVSSGLGNEDNGGEGSNSLKIEVIVEPVDASVDKTPPNKSEMSEFMIPLLLAVLLTTTAILVLSAVLVFFRRGGLSSKKNEKAQHKQYSRGLVVACPGDGNGDKSGSNSNLSSSSTADSVLFTDSETTQHSPKFDRQAPPPVSPETLNDLIEILKNQPGLIKNRPPLEEEQYNQISSNQHCFAMGDSRHDDVTPLPGPCAHCCGCSEENRVHRHGDSCRAHHNQGRHGRPQSSLARSGGSKNSRGLSIRTNKQPSGAQPSIPPPLSPISEVSSVTSSMMSLPITSANSQTSLLKQVPKSSPAKSSKKELTDNAPVSEAFVASESDNESGISEASRGTTSGNSKLRFSRKINEKLAPGRYLGGVAGACYDSGYATSNYEEEEDRGSSGAIKKKDSELTPNESLIKS